MHFLIIFGFIVIAMPISATAASFDCALAKTSLEILICSDTELSALDTQVGQTYLQQKTTSNEGEKSTLLEAQRKFLRERTEVCNIPFKAELSETESNHVITCLKNFYKLRINALTVSPSEQTPSQQITSQQSPTSDSLTHNPIPKACSGENGDCDKPFPDYNSKEEPEYHASNVDDLPSSIDSNTKAQQNDGNPLVGFCALIATVYYFIRRRHKRKATKAPQEELLSSYIREELLSSYNFNYSYEYGDRCGLAVDNTKEKLFILTTPTVSFSDIQKWKKTPPSIEQKLSSFGIKIFEFTDLINSEIVYDGERTTTSTTDTISAPSAFGDAAIGGLFFGKTGAIVGAISSERKSTSTSVTTREIEQISVRLTINSLTTPVYRIPFLKNKAVEGSKEHSEAIRQAENWHGLFLTIIKRQCTK